MDERSPTEMKPGAQTDEPRTSYHRSSEEEGGDGGRFSRGDGEGAAGTSGRTEGMSGRTESAGERTEDTSGRTEGTSGRTEGDTRTRAHRGTAPASTTDRARERFGGLNWGAAFFGWLVAVGMTALLTGILSAGGAAIGLTELSGAEARAEAETISLVGGLLLLAVTLAAFGCGGYVAGRMSRFDGARQGAGVWALGLLVTIALGIVAVVLGSEYNVVERIGLPRLPIGEETLTTGGIVATVAILGGTLLAAMVGGKAGKRYHDKVDREGGTQTR